MRSPYPALSITRPWAQLILCHRKGIENRAWSTNYRGPMWVHAAKSWQGSAVDFAAGQGVEGLSWSADDYPTGIIGLVDLVGVCEHAKDGGSASLCGCGPWAAYDQCHWRLDRPTILQTPIACNGRLGLWWPTGDLAVQVSDALVLVDGAR